ncbi:unnamed protein product [Ectocarpus sp. CCAP 1310/34]|nr:unnamed protein product [Ectocarpus sp. CCAP 1310/34]
MDGARREEEARRAAEKAAEDARIEGLVNERVTATQARMEQLMEQKLAEKMAKLEVRQRAEQQSTEDLRSGTEKQGAPHQQQAGSPSPNPSADDLTNSIANAIAGRLQTSSGDIMKSRKSTSGGFLFYGASLARCDLPRQLGNDHLVSALSSDYTLEKRMLDIMADLTLQKIEQSVKDAYADLVRVGEEEQKSGVGHAFVASSAPRGEGGVAYGSSGNGGGQDGKGDGRSRSNEPRGDRCCHLHPWSNHTDAECYQQQRQKECRQHHQR